MSLIEKNLHISLNQKNLFETNPIIAVAVSGGPDSIALVFLLKNWIIKNKGKLTALIIDHQIRENSFKEAISVKKYLSNNNIQSLILKVSKKYILKGKMVQARENRYTKIINYCRKNKILNLSPDEQFQIAFDLLRSQKFDQAKKTLEEFINNNNENQLAGSAYYWLGEIHLLKKNYREAALIFAEGYQKYPTSIKSPDSLYKLAEALSQIDKINDACNTLKKFKKEYINHKLINKTNSMIIKLECE